MQKQNITAHSKKINNQWGLYNYCTWATSTEISSGKGQF